MSDATTIFREEPQLRDAAQGSTLLVTLRQHAKQVTIDEELFYVVEGDLVLDEDQLALYALQRETVDRARLLGIAAAEASPQGEALVGIMQGGKIVRWKADQVLSYCVLRDTLFSQDRYELVRESMRLATADWEATCGVRFQHRDDLDGSPGTQNPGVLFTVRGIDAGGQFIAAAFFPNDPANRRRMVIDPWYFAANGFNKVGVLRHELGHVLGFRHEHIRSGAPPACSDEDVFGTVDLTQYDPRSVMHYFCGGAGTPELALTELDRIGSQKVYGPPLGAFFLVE